MCMCSTNQSTYKPINSIGRSLDKTAKTLQNENYESHILLQILAAPLELINYKLFAYCCLLNFSFHSSYVLKKRTRDEVEKYICII